VGFWGSVREAFRVRPEQTETRTIDTLPWGSGGVGPSVGPLTQDRALTLAPVFAAARILAGTISTLPLKAYRRIGDDRVPMGSLPQLFAQLDTDGELVNWLHRCVTSLVLRGNAYGLITARDGFGFPTRIDWLNPSDVTVDDYRSVIRPVWYWRGREIPIEDFVHIPWFPTAGRAQGLSPLGAFMTTINTGLAAQDYGNSWFDNGGFPPGTFKNTAKELSQDQADAIKARLRNAMLSRSPLVYGSDWDYSAITVPPNEAQFVETMRLSATQVASIYGVVPEDIGGTRGQSLTYATTELNQLDRIGLLRPWLVILEHKFASLLPERQYVKLNADATVRTDIKSRWEVHQIAVGLGARSLDEVRALEDQPPLPNGAGADYQTPAVKAAQAPPQLQQAPQPPPDISGPKRVWEIPA
jgi:HK97 family phage portal protein